MNEIFVRFKRDEEDDEQRDDGKNRRVVAVQNQVELPVREHDRSHNTLFAGDGHVSGLRFVTVVGLLELAFAG